MLERAEEFPSWAPFEDPFSPKNEAYFCLRCRAVAVWHAYACGFCMNARASLALMGLVGVCKIACSLGPKHFSVLVGLLHMLLVRLAS